MYGMTEEEVKLREQLEEEAKVWVKEEIARRFQVAKETLEQQARESEAYIVKAGITEPSKIASETQLSISYARSELGKDVRFEADKWVEEEVMKRLKK